MEGHHWPITIKCSVKNWIKAMFLNHSLNFVDRLMGVLLICASNLIFMDCLYDLMRLISGQALNVCPCLRKTHNSARTWVVLNIFSVRFFLSFWLDNPSFGLESEERLCSHSQTSRGVSDISLCSSRTWAECPFMCICWTRVRKFTCNCYIDHIYMHTDVVQLCKHWIFIYICLFKMKDCFQ